MKIFGRGVFLVPNSKSEKILGFGCHQVKKNLNLPPKILFFSVFLAPNSKSEKKIFRHHTPYTITPKTNGHPIYAIVWTEKQNKCGLHQIHPAPRHPSQNLNSVLGAIRLGPYNLARPREVLHTQFDCPMVTKVVVAITWLPVGIGCNLH